MKKNYISDIIKYRLEQAQQSIEYSREQVKILLNKSIDFNKEIDNFIQKGLK